MLEGFGLHSLGREVHGELGGLYPVRQGGVVGFDLGGGVGRILEDDLVVEGDGGVTEAEIEH